MNSDLDNEASTDDLRHETNEDVGAFYGGNENNDDGEEIEAEAIGDELADRADKDDKSHAAEWLEHSRGCERFQLVYAAKGQEEEEEDEASAGLEDDSIFSPVKYDQTRFRYAALSEQQRQDVIRKLQDLVSEANVLMILNKFLHKNYIDVNRKSPSMANALDKFDETLIFEDPRYQTTLENFAQTRDDVDERRASLTAELENLSIRCSSAEWTYAKIFDNLLTHQYTVAKKIKPPKCDKESWLMQVERLLEKQRQRASEVAKIRLAHVHLQSKLAKLVGRLKQFDSLGPGLSMMDYEYLLKRKDIYSERREEQQELMKKLKEKNLASAAISRHIAEESDLYDDQLAKNLKNLDVIVNANATERSRAVQLAKMKVSISKSMTKLKEDIGLLNYPFLLRKMERDLRELAKLQNRTDSLQAKITADAQIIAKSPFEFRVFDNQK